MKMVILAAGQGTRLRPLTDDKPKCMVSFKDKPIIDYIFEAALQNGISDISVVAGYKKEAIFSNYKDKKMKYCVNEDFERTNMVSSLFCAESEFDDDIIISYSDIIYTPEVLRRLIQIEDDVSVVVDLNWRKLWELRMDNPLSDAETMKIDRGGNIIELGRKTDNYEDIQGQYIGLIKIRKNILSEVVDLYKNTLDKTATYDGKDYDNMYMTSFIQLIIDRLTPVKAVFIKGGWIEVDSIQDLEKYHNADISQRTLQY